MEHLRIKSVVVHRPSEISIDTGTLIQSWLGQYATGLNTKFLCREYKKAIGWKKYRVRFSEFDCRVGKIVLRVTKI